MYRLDDSIMGVAGIGPALIKALAAKNIFTVKDLLLFVPLRYEDRSQNKLIAELVPNELVTIEAEVTAFSNQYKGRRSIQRATVKDESGKLPIIWFNTPFLKDSIVKGNRYFFSGKLSDRGQMAQPTVEKVSEDTIHTNRLVPIYSTIPTIQPGKLRRILKHVIDTLHPIEDPLSGEEWLSLTQTFQHLHFPDDQELTIKSRERLALEELLGLMHHSQHIKAQWINDASAHQIESEIETAVPNTIPFQLTTAQHKAIREVLTDLNSNTPMNRLLLGDVGSGKTVVAGVAALQSIKAGHSATLVAPTQILAEQHFNTLQKLFPTIFIQFLTGKKSTLDLTQPSLIVGTHAVLNQLEKIQPALVIYDEQHRFGVEQRAAIQGLTFHPHTLTMSATPIPRSMMLTLFSHLELSVLDELPAGRLPVKTWLVPERKRSDSYDWIREQLKDATAQVLVVCPFIDPSDATALENVKAATEMFENIKQKFPNQTVELLHGKLKPTAKDKLIKDLFDKKIQILVTTPIVEVGVDLPAASVMIIESAERFGLASLHQLRGRVGRAGQQAYCLLFTTSKSPAISDRLKIFTETNDGMKLAEYDMQNRGAGDLFGTQQHGFEQLRFAQWTNLELIASARKVFDELKTNTDWQPLLKPDLNEKTIAN